MVVGPAVRNGSAAPVLQNKIFDLREETAEKERFIGKTLIGNM